MKNRYTKNRRVNKIIEQLLKRIVQIVVSNSNPQAVLLGGSFARGEGSFFINRNKITFFSDLDIYIIGKIDMFHHLTFLEKVVRESIYDLPKIEINLMFINVDKLNKRHDDMSSLDTKYQYILLYGEPIHKKIKINEKRALKTSIRFLMAKSVGLLEYSEHMSKNEVLAICSRTYMEMSTVLCASAGIYKRTHEERCKVIKKFHQIDRLISDRIIKFTRFKIGYKEIFKETKKKIFQQTIRDLSKIWAYVLDIDIQDALRTTNIFKNRLKEEFFRPYVEEVFERYLNIKKVPLSSFWVYLIQIYDLLPFLNLLKANKIENIYIDKIISPYILIYTNILYKLNTFNITDTSQNIKLIDLWNLHAKRRDHFL